MEVGVRKEHVYHRRHLRRSTNSIVPWSQDTLVKAVQMHRINVLHAVQQRWGIYIVRHYTPIVHVYNIIIGFETNVRSRVW